MRWHLNCIYALMLILSPVFGHPHKRALDLDISVEPTQLDDYLDVPKFAEERLDKGNRHVESSTHSIGKLDSNFDAQNRYEKLITFKMHQYRHKMADIRRRKRRRRLVNIPSVLGGAPTYLGNLAAATNDAFLRMQNYAATMMVILTTAKATKKEATQSIGLGNLTATVKPMFRNNATISHKDLKSSLYLFKRKSGKTTPYYFEARTSKPIFTRGRPIVRKKETKSNKKPADEDYVDPLVMADGFGNSDSLRTDRDVKVPIMELDQLQLHDLLQVVSIPTVATQTPLTTAASSTLKATTVSSTTKSTRHTTENPAHNVTQTKNAEATNVANIVKNVDIKMEDAKSVKRENSSSTANHTARANEPIKKFNPYGWENDVLKETNIKIKKGAEQSNNTCNGGKCDKVIQDMSKVYNDSAADCNKESETQEERGGFDIPSNDDSPEDGKNATKECNYVIKTTTTEATKNNTCGAVKPNTCGNDDDDDGNCDDGREVEPKTHPVSSCSDKGHKKDKAKHMRGRQRRQVGPSPNFVYSTAPQYTILKMNNSVLPNLPNLPDLSGLPSTTHAPVLPMVYTYTTNAPDQRADQPQTIFTISTSVSTTPSTATTTQPAVVVKKSIDKSIITSVIENLKVVDQKLADAVDPLHSAQEALDLATKCESTTACGAGENILMDISDQERAALHKLAYKIINTGNNAFKLKRSDPMYSAQVPTSSQHDGEIGKRGLPTPAGIKKPDANRKADSYRLQRDLVVINELQTILNQIQKDTKRKARKKRLAKFKHKDPTSRMYTANFEQNYEEDDHRNFKNFLYEQNLNDKNEDLHVIHKKNEVFTTPAADKIAEDNKSLLRPTNKKRKQKNLWKKLFGKRHVTNRFLNQDRPNSQYTDR